MADGRWWWRWRGGSGAVAGHLRRHCPLLLRQPRKLELLPLQQLLEDQLRFVWRDELHRLHESLTAELFDEPQLRAALLEPAQPAAAAANGGGALRNLRERQLRWRCSGDVEERLDCGVDEAAPRERIAHARRGACCLGEGRPERVGRAGRAGASADDALAYGEKATCTPQLAAHPEWPAMQAELMRRVEALDPESNVRPASAPRTTVRLAWKPRRSVSRCASRVRGHGICQRASPGTDSPSDSTCTVPPHPAPSTSVRLASKMLVRRSPATGGWGVGLGGAGRAAGGGGSAAGDWAAGACCGAAGGGAVKPQHFRSESRQAARVPSVVLSSVLPFFGAFPVMKLERSRVGHPSRLASSPRDVMPLARLCTSCSTNSRANLIFRSRGVRVGCTAALPKPPRAAGVGAEAGCWPTGASGGAWGGAGRRLWVGLFQGPVQQRLSHQCLVKIFVTAVRYRRPGF